MRRFRLKLALRLVRRADRLIVRYYDEDLLEAASDFLRVAEIRLATEIDRAAQ